MVVVQLDHKMCGGVGGGYEEADGLDDVSISMH